jgi:hypothetical protein
VHGEQLVTSYAGALVRGSGSPLGVAPELTGLVDSGSCPVGDRVEAGTILMTVDLPRFGSAEDVVGCSEHTLARVCHDLLGRRTGDTGGPARNVGKGVAVGRQAVDGSNQVRDALRLDLSGSAAAHHSVSRLRPVQQHVPDLVSEGLDRLRVVDVLADPNGAVEEVGSAVGPSAVPAPDGEPTPARHLRERIPEAVRRGTLQLNRRRTRREGLAALRTVEEAGPATRRLTVVLLARSDSPAK